MGVGCSHGNLIDQNAASAVIKFKNGFKPKRIFHLGDWCDTAALRGGSKGTSDEGKPINCDIDEGLLFLEALGVTDCTMGNHDERPWRYLGSPNAMHRELGQMLVDGIERKMKKLKINWRNSWDVRSWIDYAGYKWMHGYMFGENASRDHAEAHGNVIFAHTHTTAVQKGRRDDCPTGINIGTLCTIGNMDYAKNRRKTLSWSQGFVWGESYKGKVAYIYLHENGQRPDWNLPF